mgnify:CR=1 FL=1
MAAQMARHQIGRRNVDGDRRQIGRSLMISRALDGFLAACSTRTRRVVHDLLMSLLVRCAPHGFTQATLVAGDCAFTARLMSSGDGVYGDAAETTERS